MGKRLSKIVTMTGDDGTTGLADGSRLLKSDIRIQCLGEVDELNASTGLCISLIKDQDIIDILLHIQHDLFDLGAELCQPSRQLIIDQHVDHISQIADTLNSRLPALKEFILPGGSTGVAQLHVTRTVCRRVERTLVDLNTNQSVNPFSLKYINRLSDLLFILPRFLSLKNNEAETYWQSAYSRVKA